MWPCQAIKHMPSRGTGSADVPFSAWVLQCPAILLRGHGLLKNLVLKASSACLQGACISYDCRLGGNPKVEHSLHCQRLFL